MITIFNRGLPGLFFLLLIFCCGCPTNEEPSKPKKQSVDQPRGIIVKEVTFSGDWPAEREKTMCLNTIQEFLKSFLDRDFEEAALFTARSNIGLLSEMAISDRYKPLFPLNEPPPGVRIVQIKIDEDGKAHTTVEPLVQSDETEGIDAPRQFEFVLVRTPPANDWKVSLDNRTQKVIEVPESE
jgi:hypothetical protein